MKKTLFKMTVLLTVSVFGLAACGPMDKELSNGSEISNSSVGEKVYYDNPNAENDTNSEIDQEYAEQCDQWERLDDGSFQCVSEDSNLFGQYLFEGLMFATIGAMLGNALYKKNNRVDGTSTVNNNYYNDTKSNKEQNTGATSNKGSTVDTNNADNSSTNNAAVNNNGNTSNTASPADKSGTTDINTKGNSSADTSKNKASSVTGSKSQSSTKAQSFSKPKTIKKSYKSNRKSFSGSSKRR